MNGDHRRLRGVILYNNGVHLAQEDKIDMELDDAVLYILNKYISNSKKFEKLGLIKVASVWAQEERAIDKRLGFVSDKKALPVDDHARAE